MFLNPPPLLLNRPTNVSKQKAAAGKKKFGVLHFQKIDEFLKLYGF